MACSVSSAPAVGSGSTLGYLLGGLYLLKMKVIQWQIPVGHPGGAVHAWPWCFTRSIRTPIASPVFQLFSGAAMLGAFFIATDPVSASTTRAAG